MNSNPQSEPRNPKALGPAGPPAMLALLLWTAFARAEPDFQFDFKPVVPGVDQAHLERQTKAGPWSIFVVRVDRSRGDLKIRPVLATESGKAVLPLSKQVQRCKLEGWHPVAAMNANLFAKDAGGFIAGLHIADGEVCSTPNWPHTETLWADDAGRLHITQETNGFSLTWPDGHTTPLRLNEPTDTNTPTLFAGAAKCLLTRAAEPRLVLEWETTAAPFLPASVTRQARLVGGTAPETAPAGRVVLVPGPRFREQAQGLKAGATFVIGTRMSHDLSGATWAVSGVPHLISGGTLHGYFSQPPAPGQPPERHPRSLIGFNDRDLFFVVVDGRQPNKSVGMDFSELCQLMQQLSCTEALSLDGGGSTTLWVGDRVVNSPSNRLGWERPIANAIMVLRRND